jgi:hypothetical protein
MITTLSFYDFDGTLIDSPMPDTGRVEWKNKTGKDYPHEGWWGRPDSLNTDVFDVKPFPAILNQLKADMTKSDTYVILLTARIGRLQDAIENVLRINNIQVDEVSVKNGGAEKDVRVKNFLTKFPNVDTINLYDDRDKEMKVFGQLKNDIGDKYQVNIYRATDGSFALVESTKKALEIVSEEISIYKRNNIL